MLKSFTDNHAKVLKWLPAILTMIAIFILSSTPAEELNQITEPTFTTANQVTAHYALVTLDWYKVGHIIGYALLGMLLLTAFKLYVRRPFLATILVTALYASSDEFHQRFVAGRHSSFDDVLLDLFAAIIAILIFQLYLSLKNKTPHQI